MKTIKNAPVKPPTLRPIGSEVEVVYFPNLNRMNFTVWRYLIIDHSLCENAGLVWTETLKPLRKRVFGYSMMILSRGELVPVPPEEIMHLLDEGWAEILRRAKSDPKYMPSVLIPEQ